MVIQWCFHGTSSRNGEAKNHGISRKDRPEMGWIPKNDQAMWLAVSGYLHQEQEDSCRKPNNEERTIWGWLESHPKKCWRLGDGWYQEWQKTAGQKKHQITRLFSCQSSPNFRWKTIYIILHTFIYHVWFWQRDHGFLSSISRKIPHHKLSANEVCRCRG